MKKILLFTAVLMVSVCVQAQTNFVFESTTNHVLVSDYTTFDPGQSLWFVVDYNDGSVLDLYRVYVPKAVYDAGWAAFPLASKDAAKAAALDWYSNSDNWEGQLRALKEVLYDEINAIRTDPKLGLPAVDETEQKNKIKDKDPGKNKKPKKPKKNP